MNEQQLATVIGENVRRVRTEAGLSQAQLRDRSGIAVPHLSRLESGRQLPSLSTLHRVAQALAVPMSSLISEPVKENRHERA